MSNLAESSFESSSTYLDQEQLVFFENKLRTWRKELCRVAHPSGGQEFCEVHQPDWVDEAANKSQLELSLANRMRVERLMRDIDEALSRIREGNYGYCFESGEEIGLKRLLALPTAKFSVETQEKLEHRRRFYS